MQMQLPLFPANTRLINLTWGVFEKDDFVYYLHNGSPVYCHHKGDLNNYRFITANLVNNKSCHPSELSKVFGVNRKNFQRYSKRLREKGISSFFNPVDNRGKCYKMTPDKFKEAQEYLDSNYSQLKTANNIGVSESAIRYHIKKGTLKKKRK